MAHIHLEQQGLIKEKASITAISDVLTEHDFNAVIMVGICFGFDETKQKLTDVVVSKYIQPYESVKISNGVLQNRNVRYEPDSEFVNKFLNYNMPSNNNISYHPGTLLCGEKLLDDVLEKKKIISLFPNTKDFVGGDMESAGIASAMNNRHKHNYIIIKGISDWGYKKNHNLGENEKNQLQFNAAYNAVRFAYEVLSSADFSSLGIKEYQKHAKEIFDKFNQHLTKDGIMAHRIEKETNSIYIRINDLPKEVFRLFNSIYCEDGEKILFCDKNELEFALKHKLQCRNIVVE